MIKTFEQGREEIARLCAYYATNRATLTALGVKEAHVRQTLIDPLFIALGWDVGNAGLNAPQYREVIPEDSLDVEGQQKAPDYAFRVGTLVRFYVEAKRCGVNIRTDAAPAYQLRRYGWSAKVALSLLTNFEDLCVYDCTRRPSDQDQASRGRILLLNWEEYPERFCELWDVYSREAVWSGAFDHFAASKRKRGTSEVDVEFLKEIEGWRETLARNVALRNPNLSPEDLNAAVQRTIDRVVFLRMAEDRGLEPEGQLLKLCERDDVYARFMRETCRRADDKYNSGLFHFHDEPDVAEAPDRVTPGLDVDDKTFKPILQGLYYAHGSPYHFGVIPVEILGTVYERFLGKVIRLTSNHQAKVEEKPEVRKAGGVFYTPSYIVDYIVGETVGRLAEGKSPAQLAGGKRGQPLRVLDMACGSGSFLLGAYQFLLDHCLRWYIEHQPKSHPKAVYNGVRSGLWRLSIEEKKRILTTHIFGVDIDPQAVEVSKLSLLLKVLENENDQSVVRQRQLFHDRALPNLAENIKCGNSLIGPDYFLGRLLPDPEEMRRVNPFDWRAEFPAAMKSGGFDCVIGNPPYVRMETFKAIKEYLRENFTVHEERADIYAYFVERGLRWLRPRGTLGMIVSNKFCAAKYGEPLRECIQHNAEVLGILDLAGANVFHGATVRTLILVMKPRHNAPQSDIRYAKPPGPEEFAQIEEGALSLSEYATGKGTAISPEQITAASWQLLPANQSRLVRRLANSFPTLREAFDWRPLFGVKTGLNDAFVIDEATRIKLIRQSKRSDEVIRPFLMGKDARRYAIRDEKRFLIYLHPEKQIDRYPAIRKHLEPFRKALNARATDQRWFELQQPAVNLLPLLAKPKLVYPIIASEPRFALDTKGFFVNDKLFVLPTTSLYLLGLLNSSLSRMFFGAVCARLEGANDCYFEFRAQYVERFPVRVIDPSNKADRAAHDRIVKLVEAMLELQRHLAEAKSENQKIACQRQVDATDAEIDRLVYELYGLTDEEIAVVEEAVKDVAPS